MKIHVKNEGEDNKLTDEIQDDETTRGIGGLILILFFLAILSVGSAGIEFFR